MRKLLRLLVLAGVAVVAIGHPAAAAPFSATLGLSASGLGGGGPVFVTGSGSGTSAPLLVTLPGGVFAGSDAAGVTGNPFVTALELKVTANYPGSFTGSALKGGLPLRGHLLFLGGMSTLLDVPLSIPVTYGYLGFGVGGTLTFAPMVSVVQHRAWSKGPAVVTGLPYEYTYHIPVGNHASQPLMLFTYNGTAMYTGTDSRTPGGLGQVTLVSPTKVRIGTAPGGVGTFVLLGTLTLSFVPEPGTLVLLGAGAVGLGLLGRARRR